MRLIKTADLFFLAELATFVQEMYTHIEANEVYMRDSHDSVCKFLELVQSD